MQIFSAMKKIYGAVFALFFAGSAAAQGITGDWGGTLKAGPQSLKIVLHIAAADTGYAVTMDSPDQGAFGLPASSAVYRSEELTVEWNDLKAVFTGRVEGDSLKGIFLQGMFPLALNLGRGDFALRRPQAPRPPFPYRTEEVRVENRKDSVTLAGTLTVPEGRGPFPAVVLVTGSGPQNRNEEIWGHKPFAVIADYLTRRGIAVLRYDDRGAGASTGDFAAATTEDFTRDALAVFDYLAARPEIARKKTGIIGHSEGGTIVFMAAARNPEVAFVVSLAGCAQRGDSLLLVQNRAILTAQGAPDSSVDAYVGVLRDIFRLQERYPVEYLQAHSDSLAKALFPEGPRASLPAPMRRNALAVLTMRQGAWMRFFKRNDPEPYIRNTRCPVLALNGTKDTQVDAEINLGLIRKYTDESGNKQTTMKVCEGLNHLFQHAGTGSPNEYAKIEETISPGVLEEIAGWILGTVR